MKRLIAATVVALALPVLAACSGGGEPVPTAEAIATTEIDPGVSAAPDIEGGDPFCDLAVDAVETSLQIDEQTAGMNTIILAAIQSGDISAVNAWGAELSALDEEMLQFYADGRPYVEGESVEGAWTLMEQFVRDYSLAVATEAAAATDTTDFTARMAAIVSDPEIQAAVNFGPQAAATVREYIDGRCGAIAG
jgi:hypothetical protein